ncbi:PREDICTED: probable calcium-binding protein CML48 [Camelina sativa]|uniref:Probable calcium-binding protein CML48 n=1 Tax=Camelina sativa TaxID=90675 RepID=A0ABM0Z5N7_CAMSA|nr:PREDICTED: probable calcium-binding protein CML48 [Camelina sativa]
MAYSNAYAPSAPELPESYVHQQHDGENRYRYAYQPTQQFSSSSGLFSPETHPEIVKSFESADRDWSGFLEESELRQALLCSGYQGISNRTIRFLMFIYKSPGDSLLRLGPKEYVELWNCLAQWRAIFDSYDRDRNGKMNSTELRDAFYHLGYMLPTSVLQLIQTQFDDGTGKTVELCFDSFLECGMIVKGLTEKFKENDPGYTGYATIPYDVFMLMVIPFIASYD